MKIKISVLYLLVMMTMGRLVFAGDTSSWHCPAPAVTWVVPGVLGVMCSADLNCPEAFEDAERVGAGLFIDLDSFDVSVEPSKNIKFLMIPCPDRSKQEETIFLEILQAIKKVADLGKSVIIFSQGNPAAVHAVITAWLLVQGIEAYGVAEIQHLRAAVSAIMRNRKMEPCEYILNMILEYSTIF